MWKANYDSIKEKIFNPKSPYSTQCQILDLGKNYIIYSDALTVLAKGKELKGYKDDIIYLCYDGEKYGEGDYRLVSDLHGLICKFKEKNT